MRTLRKGSELGGVEISSAVLNKSGLRGLFSLQIESATSFWFLGQESGQEMGTWASSALGGLYILGTSQTGQEVSLEREDTSHISEETRAFKREHAAVSITRER